MDGALKLCKSGDQNTLLYVNSAASVRRVWSTGSSWSYDWNPVCLISSASRVSVYADNNYRPYENQDLTGITTLGSSDFLTLGRDFLNNSEFCDLQCET